MLHASKVIATTALKIMQNPEVIEQAKNELNNRRDGEAYTSPLAKARVESE